jgi:hypothetical protein
MQVTLYRYGGKAIQLNKTLPTSSSERLIVDADYGFEGNQDLDRLYINIASTTEPAWNYVHIDSFSRYYFVTNKIWLADSLWRLSLRCDLLMTMKTDINNQKGTVIYSGLGDSRRYDPRLVYNLPPVKSSVVGGMGYNYSGGNPYIVMACRFTDDTVPSYLTNSNVTNSTRYLIFTPQSYYCFWYNLYQLAQTDEKQAVAISNTIVSVNVVRWLNLTGINKSPYAKFCSPEIFTLRHDMHGYLSYVDGSTLTSPPSPGYDFWQITAEEYHNKCYLAFLDSCNTYADRKAQRLIDIPYVGQVNVDLDNLGIPTTTSFYLCAEISYDFGGNEYVVSLGTAAPGATSAADVSYRREEYTAFSNTYSANYVSDSSYSAETETRASQILSILGTAAAGIVSGIMTEGATVPATIASLGIGAANFALSEQKIEYQKAASMKMNGTSNGGSAYNCLKYTSGSVTYPMYAKLYKKTSNSSTDPAAFAAEYGKPDGAFRTLSSLAGTGYAQMGTVTLDGFNSATEIERDEIKNLLLSGVIY